MAVLRLLVQEPERPPTTPLTRNEESSHQNWTLHEQLNFFLLGVKKANIESRVVKFEFYVTITDCICHISF